MALTIKYARKALSATLGLGAMLLLASCGGGGGSAGTNESSGSSSSTPTVSLSLVSPTTATTPLAAYGSTTITVQVLSNGVAGSSGVAVTFASPCATSGKATLTPSATTGSNGQATVTYTDAGCAASDIITIASTGATSITETIQDAVPAAAAIQFVSASPTTDSIVIQGAGGNGRVSTALLTFAVVDTHGNPLPNQTVNFQLYPAGIVTLQQSSAITNASGQVTAAVNSGTTATTFRVNASVSGELNGAATTLTTQSDTIIVTTGQTAQLSFTLDATQHNIEGWAYDNTQTSVNIFLADANGNPVADGTPVVFSTNSGAIGSSTNGGCATTNGTCSVTFRSQNPRYGSGALTPASNQRAGLATVTASTTTSNATYSGQIGIFLSGSFVTNPVLSVPASVGTLSGSTITMKGCAGLFEIQLNDLNNNPMPVGTTITAAPTSNGGLPTAVLGQIFPAAVNDIGIGNLNDTTSLLGSVHSVQFTPGGATGSANVCTSGGGGTLSGEIDLTITTPKGNVTLIPVYFTYPH
ncbi:MAG: Ig-like domain-containing protein [Burkholderiaceae bacterium]|nr:Ig-like domain-containing protein [Burkholderiaceae bacterium]